MAERMLEDLLRDGAAHREHGRYAEAETQLLQALELQHDNVAALLELARVYSAQQRLEDAVDYLELAAHFEPRSSAPLSELGTALARLGRADAALAACRKATAIEPDNASAWMALGALYKAQDDWPSAIGCYQAAVNHAPASADALCLLGYALYNAGNYAQARETFEAVLKRAPSMLQAHHNLGLLYLETGQPDRALDCFDRATAIDPGTIETRACRAHALRDLGRLDEAIAGYDEVLKLDANFADAVINRSYALLMKGDYAAGWRAYDERFTRGGQIGRKFPLRPWCGEPVADKRVLAYAEQGLGDEIMFASCIPDLLAHGANCVIECNTRLAELYRRSFGAAHVHGGTKQDDHKWLSGLPAIDYQISVGSLPRYLRRGAADFPSRQGYLKADQDRAQAWRQKLKSGVALRVGIAWRGGSLRSRQFARSIPLALWLPLLRNDRAAFYTLQYGDVRAELAAVRKSAGISIADFGAAIDDLDELAAVISALDLVITVDNTVAHLAGALGKPVWTILSATPEWRYPSSGDAMPWYPSMRLFHRALHETWEPVLGRIAGALDEQLRMSPLP